TGSGTNSPLVKRRKFIVYFSGNGQRNWLPKRFLIVNSRNITDELKKFIQKSIDMTEKTGNVNPLRVLSLSYIFPVSKLQPKYSVAEYVDVSMKRDLERFAIRKIEMKKASADALIYCKTVTDVKYYSCKAE
ncbi:uncharacterized protein B0P05DRAFT_475600, partial [Gilbertella persicaria]|uniref:uncharacterized protein n=1 Tax=Gilbertella persicaria TaxID=101096 RepID=UPI00221FBED2